MLDLVVGTITTGLLWSLLAVGVFITFRVLDVADLTVEGTFPMGAAISAILITTGMNPILSILIAGVGGMAAGAVTGWIHTKLKIPALLAGILTMIALYSINLHIMGESQRILTSHGYNLLQLLVACFIHQICGLLPLLVLS